MDETPKIVIEKTKRKGTIIVNFFLMLFVMDPQISENEVHKGRHKYK